MNPDVLDYNKQSLNFKLFFYKKNKKLLIYDNFNNDEIILSVNNELIKIKEKKQIISLPTVNKLGFYHLDNFTNLTNSYNKDILNKIEIL